MSTIYLKPADLAWALGAAIPHAEHSGMLPSIASVLLEFDGGKLSATATDRYTLGHAAVPFDLDEALPEPLPTALIPIRYAKEIHAIARKHSRNTLIYLDIREKEIQVHPLDGPWYTFPTFQADFPKWRSLITSALDPDAATAQPDGPIGLNSRLLARWKSGDVGDGVRMTPRAGKAVLFRSGTPAEDRWFIGLQMPMTFTDASFDADWAVWANPTTAEESAA